jgi:ATP-dependent exoDNAse (exonuclease V) beta subunit
MSAVALGSEVHDLLAGLELPGAASQSQQLSLAFQGSELGARAARAYRAEREWEFVFALDELIVTGKIDLWFEDSRGVVIVDYKTDDVSAEEAEAKAHDYQVQLGIYGLALGKALSRAVTELWIHFLRPNVAVPVISPSQENAQKLATDFQQAQENLTFPLVVSKHCYRCDFHRTVCPARVTE